MVKMLQRDKEISLYGFKKIKSQQNLPPVWLFQTVRLLFFENFPTSTFIPVFRVYLNFLTLLKFFFRAGRARRAEGIIAPALPPFFENFALFTS